MDLDDFEIKNPKVFLGTVVFLSTIITGYFISYNYINDI